MRIHGDDYLTMSWPASPFRLIACGLWMLAIFSGGALAADAATSGSHWSGLPIWGAEAEAKGYQLPLPFGIGVTG